MSKPPPKKKGDPKTTGHVWDGIEEFDNPMPRWWLWTFYLTIIWAIGYTIAYPAWPMLTKATPGVLGWTARGEVAADIARVDEANAAINARLASVELTEIPADAELNRFAVLSGAAVFMTSCAQCHGSGAAGALGFPNLLDDDWLWGGDIETIRTVVAHGIRTDDFDSMFSEMPAFGREELLTETEISQAVNYVMSLSGEPQDAALVADGATVFAENCAACHMDDATGDRLGGAPNLADAIWLNGSDYASVTRSVDNPRFGIMPGWGQRLTEAQVRAVSLYVHQLGGGE